MANHRLRIHPAVTSPLVPPGSAISKKGSPLNTPSLRPQGLPLSHQELPKNRRISRCCRCLCWTLGLLFVLIVAAGVAAGTLYIVFQPKIPKYSINGLRILNFRLNTDMTLYARFRVKITARNPNENIGIYYELGGQLSVWYQGEKLCKGSAPSFYQGHRNVTVLNVDMTGKTKSGNTLMKDLQERQSTRQIPLDLKVQAPVAVKVGRWKMRKVRVLGECLLVADTLSSNDFVSVKASNCRYRLKL